VYDCNHPQPVLARECLAAFKRLIRPADAAEVSTHDEAMVVVDHWFDSRQIWADCRLAPGASFSARRPEDTAWYGGFTERS
jgi:hypothetical protein